MRGSLRRICIGLTAVAHILVVASPATAADADDARVITLTHEVEELKAEIRALEALTAPEPVVSPAPVPPEIDQPAPAAASAGKSAGDFLSSFTVNGALDAYYEYNLDHPIGRVNTLRAYDVSSDNFSINQADFILENAPDPAAGKRFGLRLDFQYGQAAGALQGNPANEPRPEMYRAIYQAYGTYVFAIGNGLTVDFGKWASSLGFEGNYTKDQMNYSRSLWFDFLPAYHTGLRLKYAMNDQVAFNLWITNGTEQTEAFNNFKDQLYGVVLTPTPEISWTTNYYRGQEHPDVTYLQDPTEAQLELPSQQGSYFEPIVNPPDGRLNIADSYAAWQVTPALTLAAEADYVQERLYAYSPLQRVYGGALYASYQINAKVAIAARGEYMSDQDGLFSGAGQTLKEGTLTVDYRPDGKGFLIRAEARRDWSNLPFFLTHTLGMLKMNQPTVGLGVVWWFGRKQGAW